MVRKLRRGWHELGMAFLAIACLACALTAAHEGNKTVAVVMAVITLLCCTVR